MGMKQIKPILCVWSIVESFKKCNGGIAEEAEADEQRRLAATVGLNLQAYVRQWPVGAELKLSSPIEG